MPFESGVLKIWEPGQREEYKNLREGGSRAEQQESREKYQHSIERYWCKKYADPKGGLAVLGADLGKSFIRYCQSLPPRDQQGTKSLQSAYDQLFNFVGPDFRQEAAKMIGGFLAEYAVAQYLVSNRAYEVHLPGEDFNSPEGYEEGKGYDLWVNLANGLDDREGEEQSIALGLQIKCAAFKNKALQNRVHLLRDSRDLDRLFRNVLTPEAVQGKYDFDRAYTSLEKCITNTGKYETAVAAVALFSTPGRDADQDEGDIERSTGRLSDGTGRKVLDDLEGIKDYYLSTRERHRSNGLSLAA